MNLYEAAIEEFRQLDEEIEMDQWRQAEITAQQLEHVTVREWALSVGKGKSHVHLLGIVWRRYGVQSAGQRISFADAYRMAETGQSDPTEASAVKNFNRANSALGQLPAEQKAQVARDLLKDRDVADKVAADPVAASHAAAAIDRHTERQRELQKNVRRQNDDDGYPVNPMNLVWEFRQLHKTVDRIAVEVSKRGAIVGPEERDALIEEVAWVRNAMSMIEDGIRGGSVDAALARILAGEV